MIERRITPLVEEDLARKMVLLSGPRQCGKTTLAKGIVARQGGRYYSWDIARDRRSLLADELDLESRLWVFDELHKSRRWRSWLKGVFDEHHAEHSILVTGSARLDLYGRGGDSLQGRYLPHRLHPLTLSEVSGTRFAPDHPWLETIDSPGPASRDLLDALLQLGGFPEPFAGGSTRQADRWRLAYGTRLVREDVRDLEAIRDLDRLELLFDRLASCVGSPLSINALREDLEVAHGTLKSWLLVFERLCAIFRVPPFGAARAKAVKKAAKVYLWDWARVEDRAARLENLVAAHLLRLAHWLEDVDGKRCELRYFRTVVGHEVDFVLLVRGRPWVAVEVKQGERPLDPGLRYLLERVKIPLAFQVSLEGGRDRLLTPINGCRVRLVPAARFLAALP